MGVVCVISELTKPNICKLQCSPNFLSIAHEPVRIQRLVLRSGLVLYDLESLGGRKPCKG